MNARNRIGIGFLAAIGLIVGSAACLRAQNREIKKGKTVSTNAKGRFDVKVVPLSTDKADGATLGRMSIDKQFHGELEATSKGEMLSAVTDVKGSAGYVAIERVVGKLNGRSGSFVLQHTGTMARGSAQLSVTVVPDSGTGDLVGIAGTLEIKIDGGEHSYIFDYSIPEKP